MKEILATPGTEQTAQTEALSALGIIVVDRVIPFGVAESKAIAPESANYIRCDTAA